MKHVAMLFLLLLTACVPTQTPSPVRATMNANLSTLEAYVYAKGTDVGATETAIASITPMPDPMAKAWSEWGIAMYDQTSVILDTWHLCSAGPEPFYCIQTNTIPDRAHVFETEIAWGSPSGLVPAPESGLCGQGLRQLVLVLRSAQNWLTINALDLAELHMSLADGARQCP